MYEFWYNYVKLKYGEKAKSYHMDADIVYIKTDYIYNGIAKDVETKFDTSNRKLNRRLPKGKNSKVIIVIKDELGGKIMEQFLELRAKTYSYLIDDDSEDQKGKDTIECVMKRKFKFEDYKNRLEAIQTENKINHLKKIKLTQIVLRKVIKNL